ncbi:MAG: phosphatidylglycerophosphatase A family protein [Gammaproteobacteria bacterium]
MDRESQPSPGIVFTSPVHFVAFGFGSGLSPIAPGTAGTLLGVAVYLLMHGMTWWAYWALTVLLFVAGIWICGQSSRALGAHDHGGIVWDEIVGYLVAMGLGPVGWPWTVAGFVLFRAFDICKPWPIALIDRRVGGGSGIMLDDVVAGVYCALTLQVSALLLAP